MRKALKVFSSMFDRVLNTPLEMNLGQYLLMVEALKLKLINLNLIRIRTENTLIVVVVNVIIASVALI